MKRSSKDIKKELQKAEWEEIKIMWKHANWFFKILLVIGFISLWSWLYKLGSYIGNLIG